MKDAPLVFALFLVESFSHYIYIYIYILLSCVSFSLWIQYNNNNDNAHTAQQTNDPNEQLLLAAKAGAARELYEETGIDVMRQLERLQPALLQHESNNDSLPNLYKSRLFFHLSVTDADFPATGNVAPMATTAAAQHLRLALSVEHAGFTFQPEPAEAVVMLQHHSGGKCAHALQMAQQRQQSTRDVAADLLLPPPKNETWKCCGFFGSSS